MTRSPKPFCPNCHGSGTVKPVFGNTCRCACTIDDSEFYRAVDDILRDSPGQVAGQSRIARRERLPDR